MMVLVASTWRLWFPVSKAATFPQIPWLESLSDAGSLATPIEFDWLWSGLLLIGWLLLAAGRLRSGAALAIVSSVVLVALNQHRLQPWLYELTLVAALMVLLKPPQLLSATRVLVISVYAFSALSKLDFEFLHTVGQLFVDYFTDSFGIEPLVHQPTRLALAAALPLTELLIAVGLLSARCQPVVGVFAVGMHLTLAWILGPLGLQHSPGVVLWNLHFAGLVLLLFVISGSQHGSALERDPQEASSSSFTTRLAFGLLACVVAVPLGERWGYWDHWPSWAVYAPHSSRVEIQVATTAVERLPPDLQEVANASGAESLLWTRIPLDQWSLDTLNTPVYPQSRFQLGIARRLAEHLDTEFEIKVELLGIANRISGKRSRSVYEGTTEIKKAAKLFWFNTTPRFNPPPK